MKLTKFRAVFHPAGSKLDMDWIHPLIALAGLGKIFRNFMDWIELDWVR